MQVSLTVCDVDQDTQRPTRKYEIRNDGRKAVVDLCEEHAAPLEALMPVALRGRTATTRKAAAKTTAAPARRRGRGVVTLDEIEAEKRAGKA